MTISTKNSKKFRPGQKVRILRNTCSARHPKLARQLIAGDVIEIDKIIEDRIYYNVGQYYNEIPTKDVQVAECDCSRLILITSGCQCGVILK